MLRNYKKPFTKYIKKAHTALQMAIEDAVDEVCDDPESGVPKTGDLTGIWVYKFTFNRQEYLMAYRPPTDQKQRQSTEIEILIIDFYQLGVHENFYDELKRYLKSERK
ncbi:type II toxin-antitoxin system RelE/ParE family toxin [Glaciimonas sp. PCH181]|uniref:type II toxin-antitoxin system RelE/ParE family toxin n=1 Tax=Glaciimonas sp. PCH181 TaxID=2133943 RepID=UPI000D3A71FF|nr:type II toxin-antitoxin system RelE/ParE family toxin [Glaciimonas sp. PCH181]PUA18943.1 hypothetical protein C7W93_03260 [Glaciimonas sp. PCH181]